MSPPKRKTPLRKIKRLLGDQVLLELIPDGETFDVGGRIIKPDIAEVNRPGYEGALAGRMYQARVLATGPGFRDKWGRVHPPEVKPGDHVTFYYFASYERVELEPNKWIISERHIQTIIEEAA